MSNRFEREFPDMNLERIAPLGADEIRYHTACGRNLRAQAMQAWLRAIGRELARPLRAAAGFRHDDAPSRRGMRLTQRHS